MVSDGGTGTVIYVNLNGKLMPSSQLAPNIYYFIGLPEFVDREDVQEPWKWALPRVRGNQVANRIIELSRISGSRWRHNRMDIVAKSADLKYATKAARGEE